MPKLVFISSAVATQVSEVLDEIITFAPYSAYLVAIDLPIPLDEPV